MRVVPDKDMKPYPENGRDAYEDAAEYERARAARTKSWAVTVERNGEPVVTIESKSLAGRELNAEDERVIEMAARHLLSFLGRTEDLIADED